MMQRQQVESSNIQDAGFDANTGVLEVTFKSGKRYRYHGVSPERFTEFMNAPSKGSFFAREIKPHHECSGECGGDE
jgi:lysyl-tRNA synthetase class 2